MGELEQRARAGARPRAEILASRPDGQSAAGLDPFCGGGSIPLEAQRLGLEAHGTDLNPVAVLITKALIEIPPKFAGRPPVNPESRKTIGNETTWKGAQGLAEDVRYYGQWMRDEAEKRIGHLYPKATAAAGAGRRRGDGDRLAVGAHGDLPEPGLRGQMPLVRRSGSSTKKGKEAWVETRRRPRHGQTAVKFEIGTGGTGATCRNCRTTGRGASSADTPVPLNTSRPKARLGEWTPRLMAIVAEAAGAEIYLAADQEHERTAKVLHAPG